MRGQHLAIKAPVEALRTLAADRPRWIIGRDEHRGRWIVHLHRPRFAARVVDGKLAEVDWIDDTPAARPHGMLIADADAQIAK